MDEDPRPRVARGDNFAPRRLESLERIDEPLEDQCLLVVETRIAEDPDDCAVPRPQVAERVIEPAIGQHDLASEAARRRMQAGEPAPRGAAMLIHGG